MLVLRSILHYMGCIAWSWMLGHLEGSICERLSSFVVWMQRELAQTWGAWRDISWDSWADLAVCCLLLPVALGTWSCLLPCTVSVTGLIPCWADLAHQANRKPTQLKGRERVVGVLDCLSQLMEHQPQICCGNQGWTACSLFETYHLMTPAEFFQHS